VNKGEFATVLADRTELSKADANRALDGILDTLTEALADDDEGLLFRLGQVQRPKAEGTRRPRSAQRPAHDPRRARLRAEVQGRLRPEARDPGWTAGSTRATSRDR
jgi:DNA-binding protein HU-beta